MCKKKNILKYFQVGCFNFFMFFSVVIVAQNQFADSIHFQFAEQPLHSALTWLTGTYHIPIVYQEKQLQGIQVTGICTDCSFEDALNLLLQGTDLIWRQIGQQIVIVAKSDPGKGTDKCGTGW